MIKNNQFVFTMKKLIDDYNSRVAYNIKQIDRRQEMNFNILQNDENNIDSSLDFLHVEISTKHVLQNIIVAINNQFAKKKTKRFKNTKNRSRINLLSRIDFNVLSYASRN